MGKFPKTWVGRVGRTCLCHKNRDQRLGDRFNDRIDL